MPSSHSSFVSADHSSAATDDCLQSQHAPAATGRSCWCFVVEISLDSAKPLAQLSDLTGIQRKNAAGQLVNKDTALPSPFEKLYAPTTCKS
jgi:hypothetical protein